MKDEARIRYPRSKFGRAILTAVAWIVVGAFMVPFVWMVASSLLPTSQIGTSGRAAPLLLGQSGVGLSGIVTLSNYVRLLGSSFPPALARSMIVAAAVVVGGLSVATLAGFALSVLRFPHRDAIFAVVVVSFVVPTDATAFAMLRLARGWGLENSYLGLIVPVMVDGIVIFLLRQFFLGIPRELVEAARVDGASWLAVLTRIFVPIARPALIGGGLVLFVNQWAAYLWPLLIVSQPNMALAPIALAQAYTGDLHSVDYGVMFAGSVVLTLVPVVVLLPLQRYFTQSLSTSGIAG
jgi:ABC-type glycerol-3-phosphate transport system permease component